MIDIPAKDIKAKIIAAKGLTEAAIDEKIQQKLKQLTGLISEDGAAHIVANELGVELVKATGGPAKIVDMFPGMKNVTATGKLTQKYELREFDKNGRKGKVASFLLGDDSGIIRITLWNDQTDTFNALTEGDTIRIKNAYVKDNRGNKELHLSNDAKLEQNPAGVVIENVKTFSPGTKERKMIKELTGDEASVELLATVVQVYDPRFFEVDASTGKRIQEGHTGTKQTNYVMNVFLDDGSGNIRTTFWKAQAQQLTGKTDEQFLQYMDNPNAFEAVKTDLLGEIIKIVGKCKKNEQFERVELTANMVFTNVDPEEELKKLNEASSAAVDTLETKPEVKDAIKEVLAEPDAAKSEIVSERVNIVDEPDDSPAEPEEAPAAPTPSKEPAAPSPTVGAKEEEKKEVTVEEAKAAIPDIAPIEKEVKNDVTEEEVISLDDLEDLDEKL
ncbi:hypothetical protein GOV07_01940 [Candidatus Woesearchaeota archaeon]|nr:hypothetical protein [Candidatus Woesearchaeota archaeon]